MTDEQFYCPCSDIYGHCSFRLAFQFTRKSPADADDITQNVLFEALYGEQALLKVRSISETGLSGLHFNELQIFIPLPVAKIRGYCRLMQTP